MRERGGIDSTDVLRDSCFSWWPLMNWCLVKYFRGTGFCDCVVHLDRDLKLLED